MQKAVIYCRVSSAEQVDGTSLATQESACRDWCRRENLTVADVFIERGESAKTADRPQFLAMVKRVEKQRDVSRVVIYRTDRFARSVTDYMAYRKRLRDVGAIITSVSEPFMDGPVGSMMETMLSGFAQLDNDIRSARAVEAMRSIKAKGGWVHKAPFGFQITREPDGIPRLTPHDGHAAAIRRAYAMVAQGANPQAAYEALKPPVGRTVFYRVFRDPLYARLDPVGFDAVQSAMGTMRPRARRHEQFNLRGVFICATCSRVMTASVAKSRYEYYHCKTKGHARIGAKQVNAAVCELLSQMSGAFVENLDFFRALIDQRAHLETAEALAMRGQLVDEVADLGRQKDRLIDAMVKGRIDGTTFDRMAAEIEAKMAARGAALAECDVVEKDMGAMIDTARSMLLDLPTLWNSLDAHSRAQMLAKLFPRGIVVEGNTVRTFATDSIFADLCLRDGAFFRLAPPTGWQSNLCAGVRVVMEACA